MKNQSRLNARRFPYGPCLGALLVFLCAGPLQATPNAPNQVSMGEVTMIKLRGGLFQWGTLEDHSAETLTFRRMDTGGLVVVPWSLIESNQELDLRTQFGYVDLSGEEELIIASKLILRDGREVIGKILDQEGDHEFLLFQTRGHTLQIPKDSVKGIQSGLEVPALDVLSKDSLYQQRVAELVPTDPASQLDIAMFCERILDFKRALEHYRAAQKLDPNFKPKELAAILTRVKIKVDNEEQVDFLANIDRLSRRDRFVEAFAGLLSFDAKFPDSPLYADRVKLEKRVDKARAAYMREAVADQWFSWMLRLAGKAAREKTFDGVLAYLEEGLSEDIMQNVVVGLSKKWPGLESEQVRQFFIDRKLRRWKPSSYGLGTWLLGEEAALKGEKPEEQKKDPVSERDKARAKEADRVARWLRNQEMAKRTRRSEEDESEMAQAWAAMRTAARRAWIVAYYAENSGDLFVNEKPDLRNCSDCGGIGVKYEILTGYVRKGEAAGLRQRPCPTCHGIGRVRRIRYR